MKLILGVKLPQQALEQISLFTPSLKEQYPMFRWAPEESYHVTLFNFGEREEKKIPDLIEGIEQIVFNLDKTHLSFQSLHLFVRKGIILYLAYNRNRELELIRKSIKSAIESQIHSVDQFKLHTTLAKYKLPSKQQYFHLRKKLSKISCSGEFEIHELHLFESCPGDVFSTYKSIHTFELFSTS